MNKIIKTTANLLQEFPSVELITNHYFSDGVCIREMIVPAGTLVIGAEHKTNHLTTLVKGSMKITIAGEERIVTAPATFEALKGSRKVGYAFTECVVHNIMPIDSKDPEEIEREFTTLHEDLEEIVKCQQQLPQ